MYPQTHAERYNLLADVEPADEQLSALNKAKILNTLSEVICKHGLEEWIGIRLLHRHNGLTGGEIMLEAEDRISEQDLALTTMARSLSGIKQKFAPNSWMAEAGRFFPLEYSQDPAIAQGRDFLEENRDFFKDFEAVLTAYDVTGLLGPCILRRNFFDQRKPAAPAILVETSDETRRANTVRFVEDGQYDWNKMIQTTWTAIVQKALAHKSALDGGHAGLFAMACVPVTGCIRVGGGSHTTMNGHQ
jgi:hypothetical protein